MMWLCNSKVKTIAQHSVKLSALQDSHIISHWTAINCPWSFLYVTVSLFYYFVFKIIISMPYMTHGKAN